MMTTYAYTGLRAPVEFKRRLITNATVFRSSLTKAVQTAARGGEHWELDVTWKNLDVDQHGDILGFFLRLNGAEHRVSFAEFKHTQRGAYGGTPLVNGASQTGHSLVCDGASIDITNWSKALDIISFDNQARLITAAASSDGSGNVTLPITPAIRTSPANGAAVNVAGTETGIFILTTDVEYLFNARRLRHDGEPIGSLTLSYVEDVNA